MAVTILADILHSAAKTQNGFTIYNMATDAQPSYHSYQSLFRRASQRSAWLSAVPKDTIILLHFSNFQDNIEWFWATLLAGLLPAISTPLAANPERRRAHLLHLHETLREPLILTRREESEQFDIVKELNVKVVGDVLPIKVETRTSKFVNRNIPSTDPAVLMLTSGSSGKAKAVVLRHNQILASVAGKSEFMKTSRKDVFLNWIGFDHVASLVEVILHSMFLGASFIHIPASALLADPLRFVQLIERHRVSYAFSPHFFLARLEEALKPRTMNQEKFDLSSLVHLVSGGEANLVATVRSLTSLLQKHGVSGKIIRPGFGMTETCAGAIYNMNCPESGDVSPAQFCSLGKAIPGMKFRIIDNSGSTIGPEKLGHLQVSGTMVSKEYYNNHTATATSFHQDWFTTGDKASVDRNGNLNLAGRSTELMNINGIKYAPTEIESILDNAGIVGLVPSWTMVFSTRPDTLMSEQICVIYRAAYAMSDIRCQAETAKRILQLVSSVTLVRPKHIIPVPSNILHKSALGKLSRASIQASFERGEYKVFEDANSYALAAFKEQQQVNPATQVEQVLKDVIQDIVGLPPNELGVTSNIFDFGMTSIELFLLKRRIEETLTVQPFPITTMLTSPSIQGIGKQLMMSWEQGATLYYEPVVVLQANPHSSLPPLWLIHPGSGDVLVFVALAKYFGDRMVYGIRTKGLNTPFSDPDYFGTIDQMANFYVEHLQKHQPHGPYAIAGYSLGSSVAFELAKRLEAAGEEVPFLGLLDSPPRIRHLIEKLDWVDVLINVAYFLELIDEETSLVIYQELQRATQQEALDFIISRAPAKRLKDLALDSVRLQKMAEVTNAFGLAAKTYDPEGSVKKADVFWVTPLLSVASSRQKWFDDFLLQWEDFVDSKDLRFHECQGSHSKMLNAEFIDSFQLKFREVMCERGV
jgi:acyl-CoA synthetase (AMP-forming)/AMP-acid ligase II/thioesterase domain-containing protein